MPRVVAIFALVVSCFALTGCPPPSASRFLILRGTPSRTSATLFREFSQAMAQRLGTHATSNDTQRWSCREFSLGPARTVGGPLLSLYLHKPTGQVFAAVQEHKDSGHLSAEARTVLKQVRTTLEALAAPAIVRETGDFGEIVQQAGEDVYSRCHD
jgi:hypothetical protein